MAKQTTAQKAWYDRNKNDPEWIAKRKIHAAARRARAGKGIKAI